MTEPIVRKIRWEFDDTVPFMWKSNWDSLFVGSDHRVAVPMAWHFVDEIEHRSTGLILYRHLSSDPWYRVRRIRDTFRRIGDAAADIAKTIGDVVPFDERGASAQELVSISLLADEFTYRGPGGLALSLAPNHDPGEQPLRARADTWMAEYARSTDMTTFAGDSPAGKTPR